MQTSNYKKHLRERHLIFLLNAIYNPVFGQVWTEQGKLVIDTDPTGAFAGEIDTAFNISMTTTGSMYFHHTIGTGNSGNLTIGLGYGIVSAEYSLTCECDLFSSARCAIKLNNDSFNKNDHIEKDIDDVGFWTTEKTYPVNVSVVYDSGSFGNTSLPKEYPLAVEIAASSLKEGPYDGQLDCETTISSGEITIDWYKTASSSITYPRVMSHY